jgi:hypothetical protein
MPQQPSHLRQVEYNATYADADYPDQLGPSIKPFLTAIVIHSL